MTSRALALAVLCTSIALSSAAAQPASTRSAQTRYFTMQSNFWVNLHHFLYATGRARRGLDSRPAVTQSLADTTGFGTLPASAKSDWEAALDLLHSQRRRARHSVRFGVGDVRLRAAAPNG